MIAIRPAILHYRQTKTDNTRTEEIEHWNTRATHIYNNQWRNFDFLFTFLSFLFCQRFI